ncbi:MAG: hypothetical protein IKB04_01165 [Clostridia bacterium]|nr:hypothetical protein [Clostridia bacterium]
MRRYSLSSSDARRTVDLRDYEKVIAEAVTSVMTGKDVKVVVYKDCYTVTPTPNKGEANRIGRMICRSTLNQYCVQIPKLFTGEEIETKEEVNEPSTKYRMGGHM